MSRPSWTGKTWIATLQSGNRQVTSEYLTKFRDMFVTDDDLAGRMSELLWLDLWVMSSDIGVSPPEVLQAIHDVEAGETSGHGTKLATQFTKEPLKGFWHKHYFSALFLANNMLIGLGKNGVAKIVDEVMNTGEPRITEEMIETLARRVTEEPIESRHSAKKLTGEWIIFAKNDGNNYYLCTNSHKAGDTFIADRIRDFCTKDFPDVMSWR